MNIGIDIRPLMTAPRTGVGEYTYELLNAIFKIDRTNQYFLFYNSSRDVSANIPAWDYPNVKIIGSHIPNKFFNSSLGLFGRPKLDKAVLRCHCERSETKRSNPSTDEIASSVPAGLPRNDNLDFWFSPNLNFTALSRETKYILTIHDISFDLFPEFSTRKQYFWHKAIRPKKQCDRADMIITPSENTKRDIVNYYKISPAKIKVIYPGISQFTACPDLASGFTACPDLASGFTATPTGHPELVSGSVGAPQKMLKQVQHDIKDKYNLPDKFILFLGTIEPRKNIIGLIEAFETYRAKNQSVEHLVIAGAPGWKNEEIFARAKNSKYTDRIHFINFVAPEDKGALYGSAEVFVYPSFYEGFGFPVLEAMAQGTPVITANRSSLPEIAGEAAYYIDPNRPEQISLALKEILSDNNLREHFVRAGLEQVKKYSWDKAGREWLDLVKKTSSSVNR